MSFSKKVIIFLFILPLTVMSSDSDIKKSVLLYKKSMANLNNKGVLNASTKKHKTFLNRNNLDKMLKIEKNLKFNPKDLKLDISKSKVVKDLIIVKVKNPDGETEIFQLKKENNNYLIDKVVHDDSHEHY